MPHITFIKTIIEMTYYLRFEIIPFIIIYHSITNSGYSKKVLFYLPVSGSSNLELYTPLAKNLASRGHEVRMEGIPSSFRV